MIDLTNLIYTKKTIERINAKNKQFGLELSYDINKLLSEHIIITVLLFVALFLILKLSIFTSISITALYFILSEYYFFDKRLKRRARQLEKDSIFYFQMLALTLESGNNLKNAIELACKNMDSSISREFQKVIDDMTLGKSLNESLDDLKQRIPSDTINNIILNLMESNIYGNNIVETLNRELNYINDKLILETKARINKMPIKISLLSVVVFVPLQVIILVGPYFIRYLSTESIFNNLFK